MSKLRGLNIEKVRICPPSVPACQATVSAVAVFSNLQTHLLLRQPFSLLKVCLNLVLSLDSASFFSPVGPLRQLVYLIFKPWAELRSCFPLPEARLGAAGPSLALHKRLAPLCLPSTLESLLSHPRPQIAIQRPEQCQPCLNNPGRAGLPQASH